MTCQVTDQVTYLQIGEDVWVLKNPGPSSFTSPVLPVPSTAWRDSSESNSWLRVQPPPAASTHRLPRQKWAQRCARIFFLFFFSFLTSVHLAPSKTEMSAWTRSLLSPQWHCTPSTTLLATSTTLPTPPSSSKTSEWSLIFSHHSNQLSQTRVVAHFLRALPYHHHHPLPQKRATALDSI